MAPAGEDDLSARPPPHRKRDRGTKTTSSFWLETAQEAAHAQCRIELGTILITNPVSCVN